MTDIVNILLALVSIALGAIGWLRPAYTMKLLDLQAGATTMGVSEVRAASGALFVGLGLGALVLGSPIGFAMMGCAWGGAAVGRLTSILADRRPTRQTYSFFAVELAVAALLLSLNL